jgi:hypothetical protein
MPVTTHDYVQATVHVNVNVNANVTVRPVR